MMHNTLCGTSFVRTMIVNTRSKQMESRDAVRQLIEQKKKKNTQIYTNTQPHRMVESEKVNKIKSL